MRGLSLALLCAAFPCLAAAQPKVVAVNGPLAAMARAIGGDAFEVVYPVPKGTDPALWRPGISEIGEIQGADLILLNGADFAAWAAKTSLPRARTVVTSRAFEDDLITIEGGVTHSHGGEGEHSHSGTAPLTWLDFTQATRQAEAITERLARLQPDADVATGAARLTGFLENLHQQAEDLGAQLDGRAVLADHPGYEYFARAYGFSITALDWAPGHVPDAADRAKLKEVVAQTGAVLFLFQADPSPEARQAAEEAGLQAAVFEPASAAPAGFTERMQGNLDRLATAIGALDPSE